MPSPFLIFPLLLASADLRTGFLPYLRPYLSALMVGASLYNARPWLRELCQQRVVIYVAQTSYALYVFHGIFARSEEHTSELQSLMRISYAVFCLKKKNKRN